MRGKRCVRSAEILDMSISKMKTDALIRNPENVPL